MQKELKQWWKNFSLLLFWYFIFMQLVSFLPIFKDWNRKHIIIALGINILNIKTKHLFEVFKIYLTHIDCTESLPSCSL